MDGTFRLTTYPTRIHWLEQAVGASDARCAPLRPGSNKPVRRSRVPAGVERGGPRPDRAGAGRPCYGERFFTTINMPVPGLTISRLDHGAANYRPQAACSHQAGTRKPYSVMLLDPGCGPIGCSDTQPMVFGKGGNDGEGRERIVSTGRQVLMI